jgi:hypothetical protein
MAQDDRRIWQDMMKDVMVLQARQKELSESIARLWEKVDKKLNGKEKDNGQ